MVASPVEVHGETVVEFVELFPHLFAHFGHLSSISIIFKAILEDKVNIIEEVLEVQVFVLIKLVFYGSEIHGLLNNVKVVRDI